MAFIPRFSKYYSDPWPYEAYEGVGLKFSGYPSDITAFIDILQGESCNPVASRRILLELETKGVKYTTLMAHLNFNYIGDSLKALGVTMEVIQPISLDKVQNGDIDSAVLSLALQGEVNLDKYFLNDIEKQEIPIRLEQFKASIASYKHHFGPYEPDRAFSSEQINITKQKKGL